MIQPLKDMYLISLNEEENTKTESGIWIDTTWGNKYAHSVQNGIIESIPQQVSKSYKDDVGIKTGNRAYFHHFVHADDNYIIDGERKLFKCNRYHLYCIIQNETIQMLDEWLLASPILETEESIIKEFGTLKLWTKASPDKMHLMATSEHISKECERQGLKVGDTIFFRSDADYNMNIEGKEYYRMSLKNVVAVVRGGKLLPLRDEIIVINNSKNEEIRPSGLIIPILKSQREQCEKILYIGDQDEEKQFKIGDEVMFFNQGCQKIEFEGVKYAILRQEEVIGVFQD